MKTLSCTLLISILLMYPFKGSSQENAVVEEKDNSKQTSIFSFNGIGVSADLFGFAYSLLDEYTSAEVAIEANLGNRFYPAAEVGLGWCNTQDETTGIRYKTNAPYFKVGLNYNFFTSKNKPDPDHYIYGLARFAWTGFEYDIETPPIIDPVWGGSTSLNLDGVSGNCSWAEIGAGIKVKIFKGFHMGWSIRYKIRLSEKRGNNSNMWYIPGFGINKSTTFGGTYSIIYEIPFK